MTLNPGTKLGPYEVLSPLGAGGMGEVYRARDSRLGREVAIKVLPQHLSSNAEVRARFEREAKTVSALNHPYICVLYDVGREGDTDYLVMELIEGETLAARIAKGPLPVSDVLKIGVEVADALSRAHRAGVIHRDLKPGNMMLTKSGTKLMDFGLSRGTGLGGPGSTSGAAMTQSPTIAQPLTAEGTIVGTFQYMAPEQLEGKETDARADIWALGCVLYEMMTGKRAFEGSTQASLISSIMRDQPRAMSELSPLSPPALERLVRQCLAKDPDERWQTAGDVRRELEWIAGSSSQSAAPALARRRARMLRATGPLFAGIAIAAAAMVYAFGPGRSTGASSQQLVRFSIDAPKGTTLTFTAGASLSPDGRTLMFTANDSTGTGRVYLRPLSSTDARVVAGTEGASSPFWSPDGRAIAYFTGGKLWKTALDGGAPVALCDAPDGRGGDWSPNGTIVFAPNNQGPLERVPATGGKPVQITNLNEAQKERGHRYPQFLPDGKHFLYVAVGVDDDVVTYATSLDGGEPVEVCKAGSAGYWAPPGYLVYLDEGVNAAHRRLLVQKFDPSSLRTTGDPQLLIDPVSAGNFGQTNVAADRHGTLVVQHNANARTRLSWMDRAGRVTGIAADNVMWAGGALSPDGRRLAYANLEPRDVFVLDLTTGVDTRVTFENRLVNQPVWSPDGKTISFARVSSAGWSVQMKAADGSGVDSLLFRGPGMFNYPEAWSKDGRWLVARCADEHGNFDLWKVPLTQGHPTVYQRTSAFETGASISPDGRWILYSATEDGKAGLYVQSFPEPGAKYQVSFPDPAYAFWCDSGDMILVGSAQHELFAIGVSTVGGFRQGSTTRLFGLRRSYFIADSAPGNQSFLVGTRKDTETLFHLEVVMGWPRMIEERE